MGPNFIAILVLAKTNDAMEHCLHFNFAAFPLCVVGERPLAADNKRVANEPEPSEIDNQMSAELPTPTNDENSE